MLFTEKKEILNVPIDICDYEGVVSKIDSSIKKHKSLILFPLATHTLIEAFFDKKLIKVLYSYDILTPDSWWIMKSLNWIYGTRLCKRVYGPDLMRAVLALAEKKRLPVYFYGTNKDTLGALTREVKKKYKKLIIGGSSPAGFGKITLKEKKQTILNINSSQSKIVFLSLSSPKQVVLAYELSKLNKKNVVYFPVGAGFDFLAKTKKQAPLWIQNNGLEWLFRLIQEPQRLTLRYLKSGTIYIVLIVWQKLFGNKS